MGSKESVVKHEGGRSELWLLGRNKAGPPFLPEWGRRGGYLPSGSGYPFSFLVVQADWGRKERQRCQNFL